MGQDDLPFIAIGPLFRVDSIFCRHVCHENLAQRGDVYDWDGGVHIGYLFAYMVLVLAHLGQVLVFQKTASLMAEKSLGEYGGGTEFSPVVWLDLGLCSFGKNLSICPAGDQSALDAEHDDGFGSRWSLGLPVCHLGTRRGSKFKQKSNGVCLFSTEIGCGPLDY